MTPLSYPYYRKKPSRYCKFSSCSNNSGMKDVTFHRFPKEEIRCRAWVLACKNEKIVGIPPAKLYANAAVCSDHFQEWCFLGKSKNHNLVHNAIPSFSKAEAVKFLKNGQSAKHKDEDSESPSILREMLLSEESVIIKEELEVADESETSEVEDSISQNKKAQKLIEDKTTELFHDQMKYNSLKVDDIEKPNKRWTICKNEENEIVCFKLDTDSSYERHVVVYKDCSIKVFVKNDEINVKNGNKVENAQNLSLLLKAVDELPF